jgi:methyltransferase-like protein 6
MKRCATEDLQIHSPFSLIEFYMQKHKDYRPDRVNAFACDITSEQLTENVQPSSVDVVTMIFMLSAVAPAKMPLVLQNVRTVLKNGGRVLFRDYAFGDLAQV